MRNTDPAADAVRDWTRSLTTAQLECRATGHAWGNRRQQYLRGEGLYRVDWDCLRGCGVSRWAEQDIAGWIVRGPHAVYDDAPEYLSNVGRIVGDGRAVVRQQLVRAYGGRK